MDGNLYLHVLKALLNHKTYKSYYHYIDQKHLNEGFPEIYRLFAVLPDLHKTEHPDYKTSDLKLALFGAYPKVDAGFYNILLQQLEALDAKAESIDTFLSKLRERTEGLRLAKLAIAISEGQGSLEDLRKEIKETIGVVDDASDWKKDFVSNDYVELNRQLKLEPGLRWRLPSMNVALGSLRKGNFGFVFARPETGKTTFLASELSFMAEQVPDKYVIWFNNEEQGGKVSRRAIQGALGWTKEQMDDDEQKTRDTFLKTHPNFIVNDNGHTTRAAVENVCEHGKPALIVFDQIDAIKGFAADRNDLELKAIYEWARAIAKDYCPVIAVCQAGGSGEGKKWLTMNDVDNSKTGKQGTADWILGIGATNEPGEEYLRFMHLSKNKLEGDKDSDPKMRHGRWQTFIKPHLARYAEIGGG